ncbi:MAG: glycoside hydrolase family 88 protein [Verrucomicrobiaceae bacterium]|nr:glycoside hydrolase family 88 protein [Verrucomicrobiaceae bacterium]
MPRIFLRNASPITRRDHLRLMGGLGLLSMTRPLFAEATTDRVQHLPLSIGSASELALPEGLVTGFGRFGWRAFAVGAEPVVLKGFDGGASIAEGADCRLRLTNAVDVRDDHAFEVTTPDGKSIGTFVARFAALFQVQEMRLTVEQARAVLQQGVVLKMVKGSRPVWFFAPSPEAKPVPDAVQLPHVMVALPGDPLPQLEERMRGLVMLQGFGWQSGCVSEGLLDLAEKRKDAELFAAVDRQLDMYFTADGVEFQNPRSSQVKDKVGGIEEPLPWATLARRRPDHPALEIARRFLTSPGISKELDSPRATLTTEGCYTAAYPMAMLSRTLKRPELAALARRHLEARRKANVHDGDIYQTASAEGSKKLRNWARGVCWYFNGLVRTLQALDDPAAAEAWRPEAHRVAALLLKHQREDGLWGNFLHDPASAADTSGSAGLAAALARAHAGGWLAEHAKQAAQRTLTGLTKHLTPDGLLAGAAQSNKGGDKLQEGGYRTIYQMGMGLHLQLMAAV